MTTQTDFGGFDPAFIGASLHFTSVDALKLFDAYRASATPLPVHQLLLPERFEALSIFSVLSHEVRHFHDSLLAPYGALVFSRRIQMLVNLLEILPHLFDERLNPYANCLPVPLARWWRWSEPARQHWIENLPHREDGQSWVPVNVPLYKEGDIPRDLTFDVRSIESFEKILRVVVHTREQIQDLTFNPRTVRGATSFQPWQLFELAGMSIQMQDLWQMYGPNELQWFTDGITADRQSAYARVLLLAQRLCDMAGLDFSWALANVVATWCLLGSYERDGWDACPSLRFVKLWSVIENDGVDIDAGIEALYDRWSKKLGVSTVREGVEEARKIYGRIPAMLEQKIVGIENSYVSSEHAELLVRVTTAMARSSAAMVDAFLDDVDTYAVPYAYLGSPQRYVSPNLRFLLQSTGKIFDASQEELEKRGLIIEWAIEENGKIVVLAYIEPLTLSSIQFVTAADAATLSELFGITEFVFSDLGHERQEPQRAGRVFFRDSGLEPIQVF